MKIIEYKIFNRERREMTRKEEIEIEREKM